MRHEMSLHDSFHFFFAVQPATHPLRPGPTCDNIIDGAPSCPRLSVPTSTHDGPDFDEDTAPPQVVAASPPPMMSFTPGVLATALHSLLLL